MKVTQRQLKRIIKEELQAALKERAEERWEAFLPDVKREAAKLKYGLDNNTAIKLAKHADKKNIAMHQVGDLVKAWIKQHPQPTPSPGVVEMPGANKGVEQIKAWLKGAAADEGGPFWGLKAYIKKMPPPEVLVQWARLIKNRPALFAAAQKYYAPETVEG
jgi:hypothetical protein